jgi:aminopeptidase
MPDPRFQRLAQVLVDYSLELKPGQQFNLRSTPLAEELILAVYEEATRAGAHTQLQIVPQGVEEIFYRHASEAQLDFVSPVRRLITETFDATLYIEAEYNTRSLTSVPPDRIARTRRASAELNKIFLDRAAREELRWCYSIYPTQALAQEAEMSLAEYREFVFRAGLLDTPDPVAAWRREGDRQRQLIRWLEGRDRVRLRGPDIDLEFSIQGRKFKDADGKYNFPDGEIFTGPVEASAEGWVRFSYPAIYDGQEVTNVELTFEGGRVVREAAAKGGDLLTALLNTDAGARYLGEWGIGTNYGIERFTKNMLFDEKLGGTIHLALGSSYPETGGVNESGLHWDMLCDMNEGEITVDGELFYKAGRPVV